MKKEKDMRSQGIDDIRFFSDVDMKFDRKNKTGTLNASYPSWYFGIQLEEQKEELVQRKRELASNNEVELILPEYREHTRQLEERIKEVEESRPKLNGVQRQYLARSVKQLETNIRESMFCYDDMHTGEASPHEEAKRQSESCIPIDKKLASLFFVKPKGGKVGRDDAVRIGQIVNKALDMDSNMEKLRPRSMTVRTHRVEPFTGFEEPKMTENIDDGREAVTQAVV